MASLENENHSKICIPNEKVCEGENSMENQTICKKYDLSLEFDPTNNLTSLRANNKNAMELNDNTDGVTLGIASEPLQSLTDLKSSSLTFEANYDKRNKLCEITKDKNEVMMHNIEDDVNNTNHSYIIENCINMPNRHNDDEMCNKPDALLHGLPLSLTEVLKNDSNYQFNNTCVGKRKRDNSEENREIKMAKIEKEKSFVEFKETHNGNEDVENNKKITTVNNGDITNINIKEPLSFPDKNIKDKSFVKENEQESLQYSVVKNENLTSFEREKFVESDNEFSKEISEIINHEHLQENDRQDLKKNQLDDHNKNEEETFESKAETAVDNIEEMLKNDKSEIHIENKDNEVPEESEKHLREKSELPEENDSKIPQENSDNFKEYGEKRENDRQDFKKNELDDHNKNKEETFENKAETVVDNIEEMLKNDKSEIHNENKDKVPEESEKHLREKSELSEENVSKTTQENLDNLKEYGEKSYDRKRETLNEITEEILENKYITEDKKSETTEKWEETTLQGKEKFVSKETTLKPQDLSKENTENTLEESEEIGEKVEQIKEIIDNCMERMNVDTDVERGIIEKIGVKSNQNNAFENNPEISIEDTNEPNERVTEKSILNPTEKRNVLNEPVTEMEPSNDADNVEDTELVIGEAYTIDEEQMNALDSCMFEEKELESVNELTALENVSVNTQPKISRKTGNSSRKKPIGKSPKKYRRPHVFGTSKKKKKIEQPSSSIAPYSAPVKSVIELPPFLEEIASIDSSLVVVRDRYNEEGKKIKVFCVVFHETILDWAVTETLLSSIENSKLVRKKLKLKMGSQVMFPQNSESKISEIFPVLVGEAFPFAMPRIGENAEVKNEIEEEIRLSFPLEHLCELCPSAVGQRLIEKTKRRLNSVTFADEPLEWAFKETFLSNFEDSPILSDLLGLDSSTKIWPDVTEEILSNEGVNYTFPFACPNPKKFYESLLFNNLSSDLPSALIHETLQLSPLPSTIEKSLYDERDALVRLLAVASFYKHTSCIPTIRSNRKLSSSHSALIESFRPLIISQANRLAVVIREARERLLKGVICQDANIIPAMINGPIHCKRGIIFSNIQKLEAAVSKDPNNKLQNL